MTVTELLEIVGVNLTEQVPEERWQDVLDHLPDPELVQVTSPVCGSLGLLNEAEQAVLLPTTTGDGEHDTSRPLTRTAAYADAALTPVASVTFNSKRHEPEVSSDPVEVVGSEEVLQMKGPPRAE